ncbi:hypothetical protein CAOG_00880 [Capsaspora owczarzaki ATCC 30864]|uniref:Runt domain-containing protein n=2 Tax=Capsaspora owczarzaki TaxID=192875 RepID=A0A0D2WJA2_CAPO3|nr:hypothetical protein CAOG_00880 [Capsaspora owczarzaki ATCC 30864]ADX60053.1 Runx1 [Capsaspora owczarzaki]KJE89403.1 hypothetical protein CAOG_000880 [Capsaspora owczarzaki ATCC 30864]|eukprot:XP_004365751.1 hypothetical protein CAOG_00880 [Capsaspora owczarzaki ATCC 30864]
MSLTATAAATSPISPASAVSSSTAGGAGLVGPPRRRVLQSSRSSSFSRTTSTSSEDVTANSEQDFPFVSSIVSTTHPQVLCSNLPEHWRCNKSLPAPFVVYAQVNVPDDTEVTVSAGNDEHAIAEMRNFATVMSNNTATFSDLRFMGRSGRGKRLTVSITIHTTPTPIVAQLVEVIKMTVDGPRDPRRRRPGSEMIASASEDDLSDASGFASDLGSGTMSAEAFGSTASTGSPLSGSSQQLAPGQTPPAQPNSAGTGGSFKSHRTRSLSTTLRRCQSAPYMAPEFRRRTGSGTLLPHDKPSSPRASSNNNDSLDPRPRSAFPSDLADSEMQRFRSVSMGSSADSMAEDVFSPLESPRSPSVAALYHLQHSGVSSPSPDHSLLSSMESLLAPLTTPAALSFNAADVVLSSGAMNLVPDFTLVSLSVYEAPEGSACVATMRVGSAGQVMTDVGVMFGNAIPTLDSVNLGIDGTVQCMFKVPSRSECGASLQRGNRLEVVGFYKLADRVCCSSNSLGFAFKDVEGAITERQLNAVLHKLHLKNQQTQLAHSEPLQKQVLGGGAPRNLLRQLRPLEDNLFARSQAVLQQCGMQHTLNPIDLPIGPDGQISVSNVQSSGLTALHVAAEFGWNKFVTQLVTAGASINQRDNFGNTALDWAFMSDQHVTCQLLQSAGGLFNMFAQPKVTDDLQASFQQFTLSSPVLGQLPSPTTRIASSRSPRSPHLGSPLNFGGLSQNTSPPGQVLSEIPEAQSSAQQSYQTQLQFLQQLQHHQLVEQEQQQKQQQLLVQLMQQQQPQLQLQQQAKQQAAHHNLVQHLLSMDMSASASGSSSRAVSTSSLLSNASAVTSAPSMLPLDFTTTSDAHLYSEPDLLALDLPSPNPSTLSMGELHF